MQQRGVVIGQRKDRPGFRQYGRKTRNRDRSSVNKTFILAITPKVMVFFYYPRHNRHLAGARPSRVISMRRPTSNPPSFSLIHLRFPVAADPRSASCAPPRPALQPWSVSAACPAPLPHRFLAAAPRCGRNRARLTFPHPEPCFVLDIYYSDGTDFSYFWR
jgi:hypothetical protein